MDRRKLLGLIGVGAGAAVTAGRPAHADSRAAYSTPARFAAAVEETEHQYWRLGAPELQDRIVDLVLAAHRHRADREGSAARSRLLMLHAVTVPSPVSHRTEAALIYRQAVADADASGYRDRQVECRGRAAIVLAQSGDERVAWLAETWAGQALALSSGPSVGRLNAELAISHLRTTEGDLAGARAALAGADRTFRTVGTTGIGTDYTMPDWRMYLTESRLRSGWGDPAAEACQELVLRTAPAGLDRVIVQAEMHRGLLQAKQGDPKGGLAYATAALAKLPVAKRSVTLDLVLREIQSTTAG
jgi:hypothetical protein